jgi:zinc transport system substrate-binding protein
MNLKNIIVASIILVITVFIIILSTQKNQQKVSTNKSIVLSTYALYDIAKHISKDKFELSTVLPFGSDAHSYELSPKKMVEIQDAQLFVYSGASLEPWVSKFSSDKSLDMSKHVELIYLDKGEHHNHAHEHDSHDDKNIDPHYWLDVQNMIKMSEV